MQCRRSLEWLRRREMGLLSPAAEVQLQEHLSSCPACQKQAVDIHLAAAELGRLYALQPPADLADRILAQCRSSKTQTRWMGWKPFVSLVAAAASLLLLAGTGQMLIQSRIPLLEYYVLNARTLEEVIQNTSQPVSWYALNEGGKP